IRGAFRRKHESWFDAIEDLTERAVLARLQRVRRSDRRIQDAGMHRGEREQRVLDAVARQDQKRPLAGEPPIEQSLRDAAHARYGLRVGKRAPPPGRISLREKRAIGGATGPIFETLGETGGVRAELIL